MNDANEMTIRLYFRREDGTIMDGQHDCGLEDFAGVVPSIGDQILDPGVSAELKRD